MEIEHKDNHFLWLKSDLFGEVRIQHHNDIIDNVDHAMFVWARGKEIREALDFCTRIEEEAENTRRSQKEYYTEHQKTVMLWQEEERKRNAVLMESRWGDKTNSDVC